MFCQTGIMKIVCLFLFLSVDWRKWGCRECAVNENGGQKDAVPKKLCAIFAKLWAHFDSSKTLYLSAVKPKLN